MSELDPEGLAVLARAGDLPLEAERVTALAPQLSAWLEAANELSRRMSDAGHQSVVPVTVFAHPGAATEGTRS